MRIGLTGKICSGKSTVGRIFAELGANVIDSDQVLKGILAQRDIQEKVEEMMSMQVFARLDWTKIIADRFFSDADFRREYCSLLYPLVFTKMQDMEQRNQINVWEVPLLFEAGWHEKMDLIILITAPLEVRLTRAINRGMSESDFFRRDCLFLPDAEKVARCSFVIENKGGIDHLSREVSFIWDQIKRKEL